MAYFKDAQDVYDTIGKLFADLTENPDLAPKFRKAATVLRHSYRNPDATITMRLEEDSEPQVDFGESDLEPEVTLSMEADTAHRFWLGRVNIQKALSDGEIRAEGPVSKILKVVPLTKPVFPIYKAQLEEQGRENLIDAAG